MARQKNSRDGTFEIESDTWPDSFLATTRGSWSGYASTRAERRVKQLRLTAQGTDPTPGSVWIAPSGRRLMEEL